MPNIIGLNNTRTQLSLCVKDLMWKTLRGNSAALNGGPYQGTFLWAVFRSVDHMKLFLLLVMVEGRICNIHLKRTYKIFKQYTFTSGTSHDIVVQVLLKDSCICSISFFIFYIRNYYI